MTSWGWGGREESWVLVSFGVTCFDYVTIVEFWVFLRLALSLGNGKGRKWGSCIYSLDHPTFLCELNNKLGHPSLGE